MGQETIEPINIKSSAKNSMADEKYGIITAKELFQVTELTIPNYQRPYKWTVKNVRQLLDDINQHSDKKRYRLGTVVLHEDDEVIKIVDGQQRTVTLLLIARFVFEQDRDLLTQVGVADDVGRLEQKLTFTNTRSAENIRRNYKFIEQYVDRYVGKEEIIRFIFERCEFVYIKLENISEAFQFFDSQNARGKELYPHNLLKAYHLRAFPSKDDQKRETVETWEEIPPIELKELFGQYLYHIKQWINGESARSFTKKKVDIFKGIELPEEADYPYMQLFKTAMQTDEMKYQLDYPIINGKHFFNFISHYYTLYQAVNNVDSNLKVNREASDILEVMNNYKGHYRTGDKYVRTLFNCALMHYLDKFGKSDTEALSRFIKHAFIWSYRLRLQQKAVYWASVDNYVLKQNLFKNIRKAVRPSQVVTEKLFRTVEKKSTKTNEIKEKFKELGHSVSDEDG